MTGGYFDDLETEVFTSAPEPETTEPDRVNYPNICEVCAGTGKVKKVYGYRPETRQVYENTCQNCRGKGGFMSTPADRYKAKQQRIAREHRKQVEALDAFDKRNPGLRKFLQESTWSEFAQSLYRGLLKYGDLTDKQLAAVLSMMAKCNATKAAKAKEQDAKSGAVDMSGIVELFDTAQSSGLKKPRLRAGALTLSLAPPHGKNPGAIYVQYDGEYAGAILDGMFKAVRSTPVDTLDLLTALAADPVEVTTTHGRVTGQCSCCGRELTDPVSIERGIGPICADKWGL